jgi:hypothetical protein
VPADRLPSPTPKPTVPASASAFSALAASRHLFVLALAFALAVYFRRPLMACGARVRRMPQTLSTLRGRWREPEEEKLGLVQPRIGKARGGLSGAVRTRGGGPPAAGCEAG